jgi:hypothetical protein
VRIEEHTKKGGNRHPAKTTLRVLNFDIKKMKGALVFRLEVHGKEGRRRVRGDGYILLTCAREANVRAQKLEIEPSRHSFAFAIERGRP